MASPHRVRVKFCGVTRPEDASSAAMLGVDAIGLVFYSESPRAVDIAKAKEIVSVLPPFITIVGLFVNELRETIEEILGQVRIDYLQFHGDEEAEECRHYRRPFVKAIRMHPDVCLDDIAGRYPDAAALLLDSYVEGVKGGTGEIFDWGKVQTDLGIPVILAGGLRPDNVAAAIRAVHPYAVDVSGGIEQRKGLKDVSKMRAFMRGVTNAGI